MLLHLQKVIILSILKVEYIVIMETNKEMFWLKGFLKELGEDPRRSSVFSDN